MKKIDNAALTMATSYMLSRPLDTYAKRLLRVEKAAAGEVYDRLKSRQITSGPVYATRDWEDSSRARGLRDGVDEFKKAHPQYAGELEDMIQYQRCVRRNYVAFNFSELPESAYYKVLEDVGIPKEIAGETLEAVMDISQHLKELKQPVKILME